MMTVSPGTIMGVFRLLGWLFPAPPLEELASEPFERLREKYRARDRFWNLSMLLAFVGLGAAYYILLSSVATLTAQRFGGAKYLLQPMELEHALMGVLLSLVSVGFFILVAIRRFLGREEYDVYMAYLGHAMAGQWHPGRAFTWLFLLFFPMLVVVCVLRATTFTAFSENAMFDSSFSSFGIASEYPYADVCSIYFAKNFHARFEDIDSPRYVIVFKNGYQWRTDKGIGGPKLEEQAAMVCYVAQQSRHPIVELEFLEDIPP
jgi:hypothetical protein